MHYDSSVEGYSLVEEPEVGLEALWAHGALAHFQVYFGEVVDIIDTHFITDGEAP